jgi:hypothetical protein
MKKFAFILVLVILILIPPHSRVVDPPQCLGICLFDGSTPVETILPDTGGDS